MIGDKTWFEAEVEILPRTVEEGYDSFVAAAKELYEVALRERLGQLRGSRSSRFNQAGIHDVSMAWGKIAMLCELWPELWDLEPHPVLLRRAGEEDAYDRFIEEVKGS